jgi:hypothetical protein
MSAGLLTFQGASLLPSSGSEDLKPSYMSEKQKSRYAQCNGSGRETFNDSGTGVFKFANRPRRE